MGWIIVTYTWLFRGLERNELLSSWTGVERVRTVSDFTVFYTAAKISAAGENPYDSSLLTKKLKELVSPSDLDGRYLIQYPPYFIAALAPLTNLPLETAWWVWTLLGLGLVWVSGMFTVRDTAVGNRLGIIFILVLVLASFPCWLSIKSGQTAFWLLFSNAAVFHFLRTSRPVLAGLCLIGVLFKLQYLPLLAVAGLCLGGKKFALGAVLAMSILVGIVLIANGFAPFTAFPLALSHHQTHEDLVGSVPALMQNLVGCLLFGGGHISPTILLTALSILALAGLTLGAAWLKYNKKPTEDQWYFLAALSLLLSLLLSPNAYAYDYVSLLVPFLYLWRWLAQKQEQCKGLKQEQCKGVKQKAVLLKMLILFFPVFSWTFSAQVFSRQAVGLFPSYVLYLVLVLIIMWRIEATKVI